MTKKSKVAHSQFNDRFGIGAQKSSVSHTADDGSTHDFSVSTNRNSKTTIYSHPDKFRSTEIASGTHGMDGKTLPEVHPDDVAKHGNYGKPKANWYHLDHVMAFVRGLEGRERAKHIGRGHSPWAHEAGVTTRNRLANIKKLDTPNNESEEPEKMPMLIENVLDTLAAYTELIGEDVKIRYMGFVLDESIKIKHKAAAKATKGDWGHSGMPKKPTEQDAYGYHHSHVIHTPEGGEEKKYTVITGPFGSRIHVHGDRKPIARISGGDMHDTAEPHPEEPLKDDPDRLTHFDVVRAFARGLGNRPRSKWHGRGNNSAAHEVGLAQRQGKPKGEE